MTQKQNKISILLYFIKEYRWQTLLLLFVQFTVGLLEGLGIMALLPLITLITEGIGQGQSYLAQLIDGMFKTVGLELTLPNVLIGILIIFCLKAVLRYICALYTSHLSAKIVYDFRSQFLDALLHSRWAFYTHRPVGVFLNALFTEAQRSGGNFKSLADIFAAALQILILLAVAALSSWQLVVLGAGASIFLWLALFRFIRITGRTGIEQKDMSIKINTQVADILQNFKPLKAMNIEGIVFKKIQANIYQLFCITKEQMMAKQSLGIFHEPILVFIMCIGLYGAVELMQMQASILIVLAAVFYRIISSARALQQSYQVLCGKESFFWSLRGFIEEAKSDAEPYTGRDKHQLENTIEFKNVSFDYGDKIILDDFNLVLPTNKLIGLLGPSGTGKTTIIDLLCGLYTPKSGNIFIDDKPLSDLDLRLWRQSIGYVPQEFVIFNDDILGNLTLGDPDISEEDAINALQKAEAWDFVQQLPEGINTNLGERGGRLSGGQRQRISIARALVRKPKVLILDEATASLDPATEKYIFDTLKKLSKNTMIIAISHQDTMKEAADLVIDLGQKK